MTVLLPVGLVFAFRPHHSPLLWWVIGLGAVAVATLIGFGTSGVVFARGIGREFGYSTWWCVRRVTLDPAHLIEFLNDEVVARGGTTPPSVAQNLDRELEVEDKIRARARAIQRTGTWFQIGALVLNFVSLVQGLSHYGRRALGSRPNYPALPRTERTSSTSPSAALRCPRSHRRS